MDDHTPDRKSAEAPPAPTPCEEEPERAARWAKWRKDNAGAIADHNAYVEQHGLPFQPLWRRDT